MKAPAIPDYVSPIVGYRAWHWHAKALWSFNGEAWRPGHALTAKCPKADHEPPADGCSCGIYAAKDYQHLQRICSSQCVEAFVHGEVYLWGKVVEHDLGYRAQFAYPKSLVLRSTLDPRLETSCLESLIIYGANIYTPHDVLLAKDSGYTQAGLDWLAERRKPWCERCKKWHRRILRMLQLDDSVMLLGRGIGSVERNDGSSGGNSDAVYVRLGNNDLYIVPFDDMVWDCGNSRWEVDLSRSRDTVILPSSKGSWKILCRPLKLTANETSLPSDPVSPKTSTPPKRPSSPDTCGVCGSTDAYFDGYRDINICGKCGAHETTAGWQKP